MCHGTSEESDMYFKAYVELEEKRYFLTIDAPTHMGAIDLLMKWLENDERDLTYMELYPYDGHPWIAAEIVELG
jgi:hypothetical protein